MYHSWIVFVCNNGRVSIIERDILRKCDSLPFFSFCGFVVAHCSSAAVRVRLRSPSADYNYCPKISQALRYFLLIFNLRKHIEELISCFHSHHIL